MELRENYQHISLFPIINQYIKYVVKKVSSEIKTAIHWLVDAIGLLRESYPRTLVYCNSTSDVS